jgi:membrane protein
VAPRRKTRLRELVRLWVDLFDEHDPLTYASAIAFRAFVAERRPEKWASAGATLVVVSWIVQSLIFRWYVTSVATFRSAVGTLAAFLVLTTYIYVASIVLLIGMQLDELVHRTRRPENRDLEFVRDLI